MVPMWRNIDSEIMKAQTIKIKDIALDWAVASARELDIEGICPDRGITVWRTCALSGDREATYVFKPSREWAHGGQVVDDLILRHRALFGADALGAFVGLPDLGWLVRGATALEAAARAFVCIYKGSVIDVPQALQGASFQSFARSAIVK